MNDYLRCTVILRSLLLLEDKILTSEHVDFSRIFGIPNADYGVVAAGHNVEVVHVHGGRHVGASGNL